MKDINPPPTTPHPSTLLFEVNLLRFIAAAKLLGNQDKEEDDLKWVSGCFLFYSLDYTIDFYFNFSKRIIEWAPDGFQSRNGDFLPSHDPPFWLDGFLNSQWGVTGNYDIWISQPFSFSILIFFFIFRLL